MSSEFDGRVYDAPGGPYSYTSTPGDQTTYRPFYALIFGQPANIERLFDTLRSKPFIDPDRFLVISPYVMDDFQVAFEKTRESRYLNPAASDADANQFAFNLRPGGEGGVFECDIALNPDPFAPRVTADRIELVVYRKVNEGNSWDVDSTRVRDFVLEEARLNGDSLHITLDYNLTEPKGLYGYLLILQTGSVDGLQVPNWVNELSSEGPSAETDPNKTLNLAPLVEGLLQARITLHQPRLAQIVVTIRKS